jgi:NAD(P)H-hydrate epimerase
MSNEFEHKAVTCAEMKDLEKAADAAGLSFYDMMENAGTCAAGIAIFTCPSILAGGTTYVFAGNGNNAGDGFVLARILKNKGANVKVVLISGEPKTEDAITNYKLMKKMDIEVIVGVPENIQADLIVDAMYGTGFHGELRPEGAAAVKAINAVTDAKVLALDIPSGLPGDVASLLPAGTASETSASGDTSGALASGDASNNKSLLGPCVNASTTVTFHAPKQIHHYEPAAEFLGQVIVADIGIGAILGLE